MRFWIRMQPSGDLDVDAGGIGMTIAAAKSNKFMSEADQRENTHLDIKFKRALPENSHGIFAEFSGVRPMSVATQALLRPPQKAMIRGAVMLFQRDRGKCSCPKPVVEAFVEQATNEVSTLRKLVEASVRVALVTSTATQDKAYRSNAVKHEEIAAGELASTCDLLDIIASLLPSLKSSVVDECKSNAARAKALASKMKTHAIEQDHLDAAKAATEKEIKMALAAEVTYANSLTTEASAVVDLGPSAEIASLREGVKRLKEELKALTKDAGKLTGEDGRVAP